ncbi:hypothetical protein J2X98_003762 [Pseudarthrobacter enclensis]|uniref:Uncharacterized protein n=1 Tax=Pseudarthrobacter enclensis TaxID=993070 RepID=A0ABT9RY25_9MICC|nr:hypothetical protein [Pseudarthrobacter enclensis]
MMRRPRPVTVRTAAAAGGDSTSNTAVGKEVNAPPRTGGLK